MSSYIQDLTERRLINPPKWLPNAVIYEVLMGSVAYGVSSDTSDMDVYAICIPRKEDIFPHLKGEIPGFGRQKQVFEQYQQHGVLDRENIYDYCKKRNIPLDIAIEEIDQELAKR